MGFFKSLEELDLDADDFIGYIVKHKISSSRIRRLERQYNIENQQQQSNGSDNTVTGKPNHLANNNNGKKKTVREKN